jgi:hypothetical protein
MAITHETQKQNEGLVRNRATTVAAYLNAHDSSSKWAMEKRERDYPHYCEIENAATGARLGFSTSEGKLHISGQFVTSIDGRHVFYRTSASPNVSIGVGMNRPAEVVAHEIERRLFPSYLPEWARNLEALAKYHAHSTATMATAKKIAKAIGIPQPRVMNDYRVNLSTYDSSKLAHTGFTLSINEGSVRFDGLEVDEAMALDILDALVSRRPESDG